MLIDNLFQLDYLDVSSLSGHLEKNPIKKVENLTSRKIVSSEEFADDVKRLCEFAGIIELRPGMNITISLQEILKICPRNRQRVDAYRILVRYLKEQLGVELIINSKKSKSNRNGKKLQA